jgi:DNA-binding transcriptional regulator of glucitol operon
MSFSEQKRKMRMVELVFAVIIWLIMLAGFVVVILAFSKLIMLLLR